jgi:hypothetical protein
MPAIVIGAIAMNVNGVGGAAYGLNLIFFLAGGLISYFLIGKKTFEMNNSFHTVVLIVAGIILLSLTFIDQGMQDVHRWVTAGPIKFYVSSIILPGIIIVLWEMIRKYSWRTAYSVTAVIAFLLTLQPDASQLTAFVIPMMVLLLIKSDNAIRYICTTILVLFVIYAWIHIDSLPPVAYVENIIQMVGDIGMIWTVLGIGSLLLLPIPFIIFPPEQSKALSICLGLYYVIVLISTQIGNFPVPLMGYGVSPIIGYYISITWLENTKYMDCVKN